jgi:N-acetylglucosamine-6-phosphate deacetylase
VVVTDAMTAAAMPPGRYPLGGMEVEVGQDRVARMPGSRNLAGSAITMPQTMVNLVEELGLSRDQAMTLVSGNPRKAIA